MKHRVIYSLACYLTLLPTGCFHDPNAALQPSPGYSYEFGSVYVGTTKTSSTHHWKNNSSTTLNSVGMIPLPLAGPFTYKPAFQPQSIQPGQNSMAITISYESTAAVRVPAVLRRV